MRVCFDLSALESLLAGSEDMVRAVDVAITRGFDIYASALALAALVRAREDAGSSDKVMRAIGCICDIFQVMDANEADVRAVLESHEGKDVRQTTFEANLFVASAKRYGADCIISTRADRLESPTIAVLGPREFALLYRPRMAEDAFVTLEYTAGPIL